LFREINNVGIDVYFRKILRALLELLAQKIQDGGGSLHTWFSNHIVINLSNALPGTYAAVAAVAAAPRRKSTNRMMRVYRHRMNSKTR
jgi:hypothetical protein